MKNFIWRHIAALLSRPFIFRLIQKQAFKRPYWHIGEYMGRWWLIPPNWRLPFTVRLHHIKTPDLDDCLHDHPWPWRTIILKGFYIEENAEGEKHVRKRGFTAANSAEKLHRIDQVAPLGVWSIFIMGKKYNRWGFVTEVAPGKYRKVYYQNYDHSRRGELVADVSRETLPTTISMIHIHKGNVSVESTEGPQIPASVLNKSKSED